MWITGGNHGKPVRFAQIFASPVRVVDLYSAPTKTILFIIISSFNQTR